MAMNEEMTKLTIDINKKLKKRFKGTCLDNDDTMRKIIVEAVMDYLHKYEVV